MTYERLVDGVASGRVVTPSSEEEIAETLRGAMDHDWILPVGGATAATTGNPVDGIPTLLDMSELSGIREYEPTDLTVSVWAGTRWSDLIGALGEHGQTIPVDVPFPDQATVGGVVATGSAGPRQLRDGTMKDLLIGASFVRGDGLQAKAGGMVVKNVSGFEIPRLLHGSYGSLAVITSVNLKVVPAHEAELTLRTSAMPMSEAVDRVLTLTRSEASVAAAIVDGDRAEGEAAIRLSGRHRPIRELAERIRAGFDGPMLAESLDGMDSAAFWQQRGDKLATSRDDRVSIEVGCAPADSTSVLDRLQTQLDGDAGFAISPGTGSIVLDIAADRVTQRQWREHWTQAGIAELARFVVLDAPRIWRAGVNVWSIPASQLAIMAALKQQFDPERRLNRDRLWDMETGKVPATTGSIR